MIGRLFNRREEKRWPAARGSFCPQCAASLVSERDGRQVNRVCPRCGYTTVDARATFVEAALIYPMR